MSFPKAKIHRYYDDVSCAPPPGKYDPKFETSVKGATLDKVQRFSTPKSDNTSSMESLDSCCSSKTPIFRTPSKIVLKKAPLSTPRRRGSALKSKIPLPDKINPFQIDNGDQKIVEEITELSRAHQSQLSEKNEEIANLLEQVNALNNKISNLEISQLTSERKADYEKEINKLRKELIDLHETVATNNEIYNNQVDDMKSHISVLEENITNYMSVSTELEESLSQNNIIFEQINSRVSRMASDFNTQLNTFIESVSKVERINKCLLEEYQCTLDILKKEAEDNLSNKQMLLELQGNIENCRDDLENALKRCKMYEVVQTETSKTINVLSKRLRESEVEVDHLNDVQQDLVLKKNHLEDQVKGLSDENHLIRKSLDVLQQSIRSEVETMQSQLLEKVECYKQLAAEESEKQRVCISEKQNTIDLLLVEIECYKQVKSESEQKLVMCETKVTDYKEEIALLKNSIIELESDFHMKLDDQRAQFSRLSEKYEHLKRRTTDEKNELQNEILLLNSEKSSLEKMCSENEIEITNLKSDAEEMTLQISRNENKIRELELLALNSDIVEVQLANCKCSLEEKIIALDNLQTLVDKSEIEKNDLKRERAELVECLLSKDEDYNSLERKYEIECQTLSDLKRDMKLLEESNQKYFDEVISELVLEKERVTELSNTVEKLERCKKNFAEENEHLKKMLSEVEESLNAYKEQSQNHKFDECLKNKEILREQSETIQVYEYERIAHFISIEQFMEERDELLKNLSRQNREIEVLSDSADKHYSVRRELEQEIARLNEEKEQLKDSEKEDSMKVTSLEARIADLECKNQELLDIIGPFKNQLMQFELERNFLLSKTENTEKELKALSLEHAKSLGHQNHKQKIKHVVNLHETIANLKKEVEKFRHENTKLRHELTAKRPSSVADLKKNKENKSKAQQRERTTSPATALKDRNG